MSIWPELSKKHIWKRLTVKVCEIDDAGLTHVSGLIQVDSSYSAAIMKEILGHEICHIITFAIYGCCKDHGKEWKTVMNKMNLKIKLAY